MIRRKTALNAGKMINLMAEISNHASAREAARIANAVMFQYYLIPRAIREEYYREELSADGVQLQDLPEERV